LAALECAKDCVCTASGMAAVCQIMHLFKPKDHIIASVDPYGGTANYMSNMAPKNQGLVVEMTDLTNLENLNKAIRTDTKAVWIENPTDTFLKIHDVKAISKVCKEKKLMLIVDNTFMTPYLMNPLGLGADIVLHSCSKYIGGHADLVMGATMTNNTNLGGLLRKFSILLGPCPSPLDCFLALRGTKTLGIRMDQAQTSAMAIAKYL